MYTPDPIPRRSGPPASSTPLADYLARERRGVDAGYVVRPRSLAEAMPLPWQQQMRNLLAEFHQAFGHLQWPIYRVVPSRYERLTDLDEEQLAERSEEHTSELQSRENLVCRLLLEKKKKKRGSDQ